MKTKVVAFRVSQEQYDALCLAAQRLDHKVADVVWLALRPVLLEWQEELYKVRKRAEAKAKRDAKKAANND